MPTFKNQLIKSRDFKIDENIAYFIGVFHSDGCIYFFNDKKENRIRIRLDLTIGEKSIPMALKFKRILFDYFSRTVNLRKVPNKNSYRICTSINNTWNIFRKWRHGNLPKDIKIDKVFFGAYLAGLIDGDGYIQIKKNKDRLIPQCKVDIAANRPLEMVGFLIQQHLGCKVHFDYDKRCNGVETCFYISRKNIGFVKDYILPHLALPYKINSLKKILELKMGL